MNEKLAQYRRFIYPREVIGSTDTYNLKNDASVS